MSDSSALVVRRLPTVAKLFVVFSLTLVLLAWVSFWPPASAAVVAWLVVWTTTCVGTALGIGRSWRCAPSLVWSVIVLAGLSAMAALRNGVLTVVGILIDILLFIPMIWFAIWYHRHRRRASRTSGALRGSK